MRGTLLRRTVAVVTSAMVLLGLALPGVAATPDKVVKNDRRSVSFVEGDVCEFDLHAQFDIKRSLTDYFSKEGDLVKTVITVGGPGTFTNPETGLSVAVHFHRTIVEDHVAGTWTNTGVLRHVTVPGLGIVFHDAGRLVETLDEPYDLLFAAGQHQYWFNDSEAFCAVLAG
ncbi:MAG: hypothetical protein R3246_00625 [Acidimicrobiia bacterium]|nr:hypothetical protein [Acidimicrobiia bacterium]